MIRPISRSYSISQFVVCLVLFISSSLFSLLHLQLSTTIFRYQVSLAFFFYSSPFVKIIVLLPPALFYIFLFSASLSFTAFARLGATRGISLRSLPSTTEFQLTSAFVIVSAFLL